MKTFLAHCFFSFTCLYIRRKCDSFQWAKTFDRKNKKKRNKHPKLNTEQTIRKHGTWFHSTTCPSHSSSQQIHECDESGEHGHGVYVPRLTQVKRRIHDHIDIAVLDDVLQVKERIELHECQSDGHLRLAARLRRHVVEALGQMHVFAQTEAVLVHVRQIEHGLRVVAYLRGELVVRRRLLVVDFGALAIVVVVAELDARYVIALHGRTIPVDQGTLERLILRKHFRRICQNQKHRSFFRA